MPVHDVKRNGRVIGYQWGHHGKVYLVREHGKKRARERAARQGRAVKASQARRMRG